VDSAVRSAGCDEANWVAGYVLEGLLQGPSDRALVWLDLPPSEGFALVFDEQLHVSELEGIDWRIFAMTRFSHTQSLAVVPDPSQ
jgi:hypothetical protein